MRENLARLVVKDGATPRPTGCCGPVRDQEGDRRVRGDDEEESSGYWRSRCRAVRDRPYMDGRFAADRMTFARSCLRRDGARAAGRADARGAARRLVRRNSSRAAGSKTRGCLRRATAARSARLMLLSCRRRALLDGATRSARSTSRACCSSPRLRTEARGLDENVAHTAWKDLLHRPRAQLTRETRRPYAPSRCRIIRSSRERAQTATPSASRCDGRARRARSPRGAQLEVSWSSTKCFTRSSRGEEATGRRAGHSKRADVGPSEPVQFVGAIGHNDAARRGWRFLRLGESRSVCIDPRKC